METLTTAKTVSLQQIRALVEEDFARVNALINKELFSKVRLIEDIDQHIIQSGGKRLRPLLALLTAKACGYAQGEDHILLAVIIEFLHTATLLHDDVVDESNLRRGKKTANAIWDNKASILAGDFLFSRGFQLMTRLQNPRVMIILANATNTIAEGEVMQLVNTREPEINESRYWEVINAKTAELFAATTELAGLIAEKNSTVQRQLANFGRHLGYAFQLIDDVLDYRQQADEMGKNPGDDLTEGKLTLPIIHAINHAAPQQAKFMRDALMQGDIKQLAKIQDIMQQTQSFDYCHQQAQDYCQRAAADLKCLPASKYRTALLQLLKLIVERSA